ncbi:MAG TPA: S-layer homology domain-containing protein, partial [Thermoanaerobaculia bacterium]|nr:S-layer homology domain-containing protein [Thermoanaerobaculia bacterium]
MTSRSRGLRLLPGALVLAASLLGGAAGRLLGVCGPFTDAAGDAFCSFVLEIFYLGITTGTTPTTFDPGSNVSRLQMAAFLSRTV